MKHQIPRNREISFPAGHYKFSKRSNAMELTNLLVSYSVSQSVGQSVGRSVGGSVGWLVS